jgi:hypothetical protein
MRFLRRTVLDPFGKMDERRAESQLIRKYQATIEGERRDSRCRHCANRLIRDSARELSMV